MLNLEEVYYTNRNNPNLATLIKDAIKNNCDLSRFYLHNFLRDKQIQEDDFIEIYHLLKSRDYKFQEELAFSIINYKYWKLLKMFESDGYDIHYIDINGENAIFHIVHEYNSEEDFIEIFNFALGLGIKYNLTNKHEQNLLHKFCKTGNPIYYFDEIIKLKLDINAKDIQGCTPLHIACLTRDDDELLVKLIKNSARKDLTIRIEDIFGDEDLLSDFVFDLINSDSKKELNAYELKMASLNSIGGELSVGTDAYEECKKFYQDLLMP
ncbi:MAG: ankyrin repeat domain-containing protein [Raineya sp.]|nr:ankyrin repeat domain-containing protein [Raineya sp.]